MELGAKKKKIDTTFTLVFYYLLDCVLSLLQVGPHEESLQGKA